MPGAEYVSAHLLDALWREIDAAFASRQTETQATTDELVKQLNGAWNVVGQVHVNLAENRRDDAAPFAFLATYTRQLSSHDTAQHRPLGDALREYAAAKDRDKLLSLLVRDRNVNRPASRIPHHVERVGGPGEGVPGRTGSGARGSGATCAFMGNSRTAISRPVLSSSSSLVLNDPARSREVGVDLAPRLLFGSFRHRTTPA